MKRLVACTAVLLLGWAATAADEPSRLKLPFEDAKEVTPGPNDDDLRKLQIERYNAVLREAQVRFRQYQTGQGVPYTLLSEVVRRLIQAHRELAHTPAEEVAFLQQGVDFMKERERAAEEQFKAGQVSRADLDQARYFRLDAEIELLKAKRKLEKPQPPRP
jgi:hypothetical protein